MMSYTLGLVPTLCVGMPPGRAARLRSAEMSEAKF
jgi:hypothetical protein